MPVKRKPDKTRIIAVIAVILGITYFYLNIFKPSSIPLVLKVGIPHDRMNILIMGTDLVYDERTHKALSESGRSDTLILAQVDPFDGEIVLLSIPRDTFAEIPGYGYMKINSAHALGGPKLAKSSVSDFLGVPVDKYIVFHPSGVIKMIDMLGGMTVYVDKDMYYVDRVGNLNIDLKKGWHHLSGLEAQNYLRFRMDPLGDINRVQRQQGFLGELIKTIARPTTLIRLPWIIGIAKENIQTDLSLKEFFRIGNFARSLPNDSFKTTMVPGSFSTDPGKPCFWIANTDETEKILAKYFNKKEKGTSSPSDLRQLSYVSILINNDNEGSYIPIIRKLADTKYVIGNVSKIKREDMDRTQIIAEKGDEAGAKKLGTLININKVVVSGGGDVTSDFTIILCKDYAQ